MNPRALAALVVFLACRRSEPVRPSPPTLELLDSGTLRASIPASDLGSGPVDEVRGRQHLVLTLADAGEPMLGTYVETDGVLVFRPAWPAVAGATYVARAPSGAVSITIPAPAYSAPRVSSVYPESDVIPANLIKLYATFDQRMQDAGVFEHVELVDETSSAPVRVAFRELPIWSDDGTMLTLLLHPGRQKQDVGFAAGLGSVLEAGHRYTLTIRGMRAVTGAPMDAAFSRTFRVAVADRVPPDPRRWKITPPRAGSPEPLRIDMGEPMDALAVRGLVLADPSGESVPCEVKRAGDSAVTMFARTPWRAGRHVLTVPADLEDLAGNNPGRAFDHRPADPPPHDVRIDVAIE